MSYELNFKHESDYLCVQATGIRTTESFVAMAMDVLTTGEKYEYNKVLLDLRGMTGRLGTFDIYKLGTENLKELWRTIGHPKVSVIDLETNRERFEFMENVAVNQNINLRIFTDVDKAMAWLGVGKGTAGE